MREENTTEREECSYSLDQEEEELPADDNVHVLTEEDLDELFAVKEVQPFTVSEDGLQQIIAHSIEVAQKEIVEQFGHMFEVSEEHVKRTSNNTIGEIPMMAKFRFLGDVVLYQSILN